MSPTENMQTVGDILGDPAGWPSVPNGFYSPYESYLLARLASVSCIREDVYIVFRADNEMFTNVLEVDDSTEAKRIAARMQQRAGDLLLEALNTRLVD